MQLRDEYIKAMSQEEKRIRAELIIEEIDAEERVRKAWFERQQHEWQIAFIEKYYNDVE